ncbi:hypothetical protein FQ775_01015 [Nitratireductor mangrovi]|uniref:Uncharacterized protein n=1 Tax=Nitratireductor mangrovi TaxID=2599600 RepID=A0A5B8KU19_9HYPH|nr:hypothetical protein [Nitratireductor mangrovi]QDY99062.1 hypothetical protein FQ775_01015 [Nitratireductor mangrovi]
MTTERTPKERPYEERSGGRYVRASKSAKPRLVETTRPTNGPAVAREPAPEAGSDAAGDEKKGS